MAYTKKPTDQFTMVPNELINSEELSIKAKFIHIYMGSKPDKWHFTTHSIATQLNVGIKLVQSALRELKQLEWVEFHRDALGKGIYTVHTTLSLTGRASTYFGPGQKGSHLKQSRISNKEVHSKKELTKRKIDREQHVVPSETASDWEIFLEYYPGGTNLSGGSEEIFSGMTASQREYAIELAHKAHLQGGSMTYSATILTRVQIAIDRGDILQPHIYRVS